LDHQLDPAENENLAGNAECREVLVELAQQMQAARIRP
jgi:hypothetical protein